MLPLRSDGGCRHTPEKESGQSRRKKDSWVHDPIARPEEGMLADLQKREGKERWLLVGFSLVMKKGGFSGKEGQVGRHWAVSGLDIPPREQAAGI